MGFLQGTYALNCLKRSLKRTHVHGSHALFLQVVLILPLLQTHPENVTPQISLSEWNICQCHASIVAWAEVPAGQLRDVGIELLYALYELTYANPLGLLEHVGKVILFMLSCLVWKHSEKSNDSPKSSLGGGSRSIFLPDSKISGRFIGRIRQKKVRQTQISRQHKNPQL